MGTDIQREHFDESDHQLFRKRLDEQLAALDGVLKRPGFGVGPRTLGAELELTLVDGEGRPLTVSERVVKDASSPEITPEMGTFDIELSTPPVGMRGRPFSSLRESMQGTVRKIAALAERYGGRAVPIGILPTLRLEDFESEAITNKPRYRALARGLCTARRVPFEITIDGEDSLRVQSPDAVAMEAANTSFQVHVSTAPAEFADLFNAAMLLTGPVLAAAANSPTFLGCRLWHETRVALFKQAGDDRPPEPDGDLALPPRVNFGNGWLREGAYELFLESVALHSTLLPDCGTAEDLTLAVPQLNELRLHHGTVWTWNRPVYDPDHGGGLRIELRALPAGPTYDDMLANAAFLVGAMLGLRERIPALTAALPFALAKRNFYLCAQHGLDAQLAWPGESGAPTQTTARELLLALLPSAHAGLAEAGVDAGERERFLGVFEQRVRTGKTAAVWQREVLSELYQRGVSREQALSGLLERYMAGVASQRPVHAWSNDPAAEEAHHV